MKHEGYKTFHPVERKLENVGDPLDIVIDLIKQIRKMAVDHKDFEVMSAFMNAIADFNDELIQKYTEAELVQIPLYHDLISSGVAEGTEFQNEIDPQRKKEIEDEIASFVSTSLSKIVT